MEKKSRRAPQRDFLDRVTWIRSAVASLAEEGADGLRIVALAKRCGVSKGSFYWHFKDRRDLLNAVLEYWKEGRIRDIIKQTTAQPGGEQAALHHIIDIYSTGRNRKGFAIELAIRIWAHRDPQAAAAVDEVDAVRLECARRLYIAIGLPLEEAIARSILLYAYVFGWCEMRCERFDMDVMNTKRWISDRIVE